MAAYGHSDACCKTPAVEVDSYSVKGEYVEIDGVKVYATGPSSATTAILLIYDIFGFSPQILQGADVLAHADDEHHQYRVYMPDFLLGTYADSSVFPPDTPEKMKKLGDFLQGPANAPAAAGKVHTLIKALEAKFPGTQQWGAIGYCWGSKIISLTSQSSNTPFKAVGSVHPSLLDPNDAKGIQLPYCMLASGEEDAAEVSAFEKALPGPKHFETFTDQPHGWLSARADLKADRPRQEYERGYRVLLEFFHKYI